MSSMFKLAFVDEQYDGLQAVGTAYNNWSSNELFFIDSAAMAEDDPDLYRLFSTLPASMVGYVFH